MYTNPYGQQHQVYNQFPQQQQRQQYPPGNTLASYRVGAPVYYPHQQLPAQQQPYYQAHQNAYLPVHYPPTSAWPETLPLYYQPPPPPPLPQHQQPPVHHSEPRRCPSDRTVQPPASSEGRGSTLRAHLLARGLSQDQPYQSSNSELGPFAHRSASPTNQPRSVTPPQRFHTRTPEFNQSAYLPLSSHNLDLLARSMSSTAFADYDDTVSCVSRLTCDRLKNVLRHMNHRLNHNHRMSGLKAELVGRVRSALDNARNDSDVAGYNEIRRAVKSPVNISVGSVASDTSMTPSAVIASAPPPVASTSYQPAATFRAPPAVSTSFNAATASFLPRQPQTYSFSAYSNGMTTSGINGAASSSTAIPPASRFSGYQGANDYASAAAAATAPAASTSATPAAPLITFRTNPFFEVSQPVSTVSVCPKAPSGDRKSTVGIINLSDEQRQLLLEARNDATKPQYQLRLYCTSETYFSLPISSYPYRQNPTGNQPYGPAPVEFPATSEVKLNNTPLNANLRGIKKKEGSTVPPDLGKAVNGVRALDLRSGAANRVELVYINSEKKYFFLVNLVRYRDTAYQVEQLKKGKVKAKEEVTREVVAQNSDPDIVATSSVLSLKCPLTFIRMSNPTRSSMCSHMQCFDAESFYSMMEQTPVFNCPVCNKLLKVEDLVIDGYTQDVLKMVPSSYDSVVVEIDGTWRTEDNKCGTNAKVGTAPSRAPSVDAKPRPSISRSGSNNPIAPVGNGSVQILDDSDDEMPLSSRAARDSAISSKSSSTVNGGGGKSGGAVIDLTLSDDEDEPSGSGVSQLAGQKRQSDQSLQAPPFNRPRYDY